MEKVKEEVKATEVTETRKKAPTTKAAKKEAAPKLTQEDIILQLQAQLLETQKQLMAISQSVAMGANQPQVIIQKEQTSGARKIKCINMMENELNVSTKPDGKGVVYTFPGFRSSWNIKFDELSDIVAAYPNTMQKGILYIADKQAVEELSLSDYYEDILKPEVVEELVYLREDGDVELFISMESNLQAQTAVKIAKLINNGEKMDYNKLRRIKDAIGIDLEEVAKELKLTDPDVSKEEKQKLI